MVCLFVVWPVARILAEGLSRQALADLGRDGRIRSIIGFTLVQAVLSTIGAIVLALPAAWLVGRHEFPGRRFLTALWVGPFTLPTVVVGLAASRLLPDRFSTGLTAIICAHIFFNIGIVVRTVGDAWARLSPRPEEVAATLGAGPWQVFRLVTLPRLRPALRSIAGLVFALCITSFGVVLLLATAQQSTIEVEIWRQTTQLLRLDRAGALAVLQIVLVLTVLGLTGSRPTPAKRTGSSTTTAIAVGGDLRQRTVEVRHELSGSTAHVRATAAVIATATTLVTLAPIALLVERSLRTATGGHGLEAYRLLRRVTPGSGLLTAPLDSLATSIRISIPAALIATVLGTLAAHASARGTGGRAVRIIVGLPLAVSAVTLGFGFLLAFGKDPIAWRSRPWIIPILQGVVAMPFVQRVVSPAVVRLDPRLAQVASTLGASPSMVWRRVTLPLLARPIAAGAGIAVAVSLGEFGATTFLARPGTITMPVAIARLAGRPGAVLQSQSLALAVILGALTVAVTMLADLARRESP